MTKTAGVAVGRIQPTYAASQTLRFGTWARYTAMKSAADGNQEGLISSCYRTTTETSSISRDLFQRLGIQMIQQSNNHHPTPKVSMSQS